MYVHLMSQFTFSGIESPHVCASHVTIYLSGIESPHVCASHVTIYLSGIESPHVCASHVTISFILSLYTFYLL